MEHLSVSLKVSDSRRLITECVTCGEVFELGKAQVWVYYNDPTGDCIFLGYMCNECFESEHEQLTERKERYAEALEEIVRRLRAPIVLPTIDEKTKAQKQLKELEEQLP